MRTAGIILVWLIVNATSIAPAIAEQQSNREKTGLIGPVRTIIEKMSSVQDKCFLFSHTKTYDIQGKLAETEVAFPHPCEPDTEEFKGRTVYTYDEKGTSYGTNYKDGRVVSTSAAMFDSNGRPTEYVTYNPQGSVQFRSTHHYDDLGNTIETIIYLIGGTEIYTRSLFTYQTDGNGKVQNVIGYSSDGSMKYKTRTRYDNKGHILEEVFSKVDPLIYERRTYLYNENGQEHEKVVYDLAGSILTREVSAYDYDFLGNWTKKTTQRLVTKDGHLVPESAAIVERVISYY